MRISIKFIFMFLSLGVQAASLDRTVDQFVKAKSQGRMDVVVLYASGVQTSNFSQVQLQKSTRQTEAQVLGTLRASRKATTLWLANATHIDLTREEIVRLAQSPKVLSITNAKRTAQVNVTYTPGLKQSGIPQLRRSSPSLNGSGVKVGIIDTGIDPNHPDLTGKLLTFKNFISPSSKTPMDDHGHGTHVSGTVAGGEASGTAIGMAPGAKLIIAKGFSRYGGSEAKDLLAALQWVADPDGNPNTKDGADILSASWNMDDSDLNQAPENEPFCVAVQNLSNLGIVPVFSAGNDGPDAGTVKVPGACPLALTVGATDDDENIADFSSRGPVRWKTVELMKPDISAHGVEVYSAAPGGSYEHMSGTSMSTPHVAGAFAVLKQAYPSMSVQQLESRLLQSAHDLGKSGVDEESGYGRLDIFQATR